MLSRYIFRKCSNIQKMKKITMITGDGASPYILSRLVDIFKIIGAPLEFDILEINGKDALDLSNMENIIKNIKKNKVALKGQWFTDFQNNIKHISPNMTLRKNLDLCTDVVYVKNYPSISSRNDINYIIVRENLEGEYSSIEHENEQYGIVEMFKVTTKNRCKQIAEFAFDLAKREGRGTVNCIHKANIMKLGDGMFLNECNKVSQKNQDINFKPMIIDNCAMQLIQFPQQFNVIVTQNLYGGIIINISAGLVGSNQILSGCNYSTNRDIALFEPATRSFCDIDIDPKYANPMAMLHASSDLLNHLGMNEIAQKIISAIKVVVVNDISRTPDLNGNDSCETFLDAVIYELENHI